MDFFEMLPLDVKAMLAASVIALVVGLVTADPLREHRCRVAFAVLLMGAALRYGLSAA